MEVFMLDLIKLSKTKTRFFSNEENLRVFVTKLTYRINKIGYAISYKIDKTIDVATGKNYNRIRYHLIEKTTYPLNS
tara:strand:+ start:142 stop:372 length:231 start_codon:yes stop_codon:yes gene_type:complete